MTGFKRENVSLEALPVASAVLNNFKEGGVGVVEIIEHDGKQAVSARELHQKLGSKYQFANWIQERINKYGFVENQDYEVFKENLKNSNGGRPTKEYALSLDMAKELCMVENNEQGRTIRKYFIEVEKKARMRNPFAIPQTYSEALQLAANQAKQIEKQQLALEQKQVENDKLVADGKRKDAEIKEYKPKAAYYDMIMANPSCSKVTSIAQDYGMSPQAFNDLLHDLGIQYKVDKQWILYQKYKDAGYVHSKPIPITHHDGHQTVRYLTVWTQKGRLFLYDLLKEKGILPMIERNEKSEAHDK